MTVGSVIPWGTDASGTTDTVALSGQTKEQLRTEESLRAAAEFRMHLSVSAEEVGATRIVSPV
jgi:hypothetical protein